MVLETRARGQKLPFFFFFFFWKQKTNRSQCVESQNGFEIILSFTETLRAGLPVHMHGVTSFDLVQGSTAATPTYNKQY